ncbi:MAG: response regulator [Pyrinomonadaceae bacterium]
MTETTDKIRVLIVDDEPIAREGVRVQLLKYADVIVSGEAANGLEAVAAIRKLVPDIVFLDVQMPGMSGFEVLEALGTRNLPAIVLVTAYDKYALQAFEINAIDYLLKPFDAERFARAFERARRELEKTRAAAINQRLQTLLETVLPQKKFLDRMVVKASGRIFFLPVAEIDWIEAADNYARLHVGRESHLIRETLSSLESRLNPELFLRIRHSAIVNITHIRELHPLFKGEYEILLQNGAKLVTSRRYRGKIASLLGE